MAASKRKDSDSKTTEGKRIVYSEFGNVDNSAALQRGVAEVPPINKTSKSKHPAKDAAAKQLQSSAAFRKNPKH
jgi:hypothetical protein